SFHGEARGRANGPPARHGDPARDRDVGDRALPGPRRQPAAADRDRRRARHAPERLRPLRADALARGVLLAIPLATPDPLPPDRGAACLGAADEASRPGTEG